MAQRNDNQYTQNWLAGCATILLLLFVVLIGLTYYAIQQQRASTHYPQAAHLTRFSNYNGLPTHFRWDDTYRTSDPFVDVYHWYSVTFDLGAEVRANGECIDLEGETETLVTRQHMTVTVCRTPRGQMVYVMRATEVQQAAQFQSAMKTLFGNGQLFR